MAWRVELTDTARGQLRKLDRVWQGRILDYLEIDIAQLADPSNRGKALVGDKKGLWRFRVGDYRIVCDILDAEVVVVAVFIGHRKEVYEG